ncbi:MAG: hypothetical protein ACE5FB_02350 [Candidatus Binatia bacterium]
MDTKLSLTIMRVRKLEKIVKKQGKEIQQLRDELDPVKKELEKFRGLHGLAAHLR